MKHNYIINDLLTDKFITKEQLMDIYEVRIKRYKEATNLINRFYFNVDDRLALKLTDEKHVHEQHMIWIEELAELQKEISKQFRSDGMNPKDGIIEEIADCIIVINQIINAYNLKYNDIQSVINAKEARAYYGLLNEE